VPCVIRAHGVRYEIENPGDGVIGKAIRTGNPYEAKVLEHIYRQELEGLAVDVGASIGNHSLWFAAVCGLEVIAIEPIEYERLKRNVDLNGLQDRITVWPVAAGAAPGFAEPLGRGRLRTGEGPVRVNTIDDQGLENVVLMKVDVEGMEPDVLRGAEQTIREHHPLIFAEAWDGAALTRIAEILEPLGYTHRRNYGATPLGEWYPPR
jgi:FkbM family methyltransferase